MHYLCSSMDLFQLYQVYVWIWHSVSDTKPFGVLLVHSINAQVFRIVSLCRRPSLVLIKNGFETAAPKKKKNLSYSSRPPAQLTVTKKYGRFSLHSLWYRRLCRMACTGKWFARPKKWDLMVTPKDLFLIFERPHFYLRKSTLKIT